jgi:spore coat protein U-like protein
MTSGISLRRLCLILVGFMWSGQALAAPPAAPPCGLSGSAVAPGAIQYDPFSPSGISQVVIPLALTRFVGTGGQKTQEVYFVLTQPPGAPLYQIEATVPGGSTYANVLYYSNAVPAGLPIVSSNTLGQIAYLFGGAAQPDTVTINLRVTVPPFTNLEAAQDIKFDIVYVCRGTGGMADVTSPVTLNDAITINVNVLSALQASYAGQPLDFGDISDPTNTTPPASFRTATNNYIRVQSSGPYTVNLTSGNQYRLKHPTGSLANATERVNYLLGFLGETRNNADSTAIEKTCARAGVGVSFEDHLYLRGTLEETGYGKTPANSNYSDLLTVTITPEAATFPTDISDCNAIGPIS